ncbi:MAG: hypothetical protein OEM60_10330 [Gammaproteobacteria bacterium]|nr:hypothetical protein [Gammaproteobacteria bacterium]
MKILALFLLTFFPCFLMASDQSPYAGEESRSIKSLSQQEIESLRRGSGMGFAKLAELNHYPGPKHVLELAEHLMLSPSQVAATQSLFDEMQRNAVDLGDQILAAESRLDRAFETGSIHAQMLKSALLEIGELRARLRYVHLEAHIRQKLILKPEQVRKYDAVRGYQGVSHSHDKHSDRQH